MKQEVEARLGIWVSDDDFNGAMQTARQKLDGIIEHYGTAFGTRNETWYLLDLVTETLRMRAMSEYFSVLYDKKEKDARLPASAPNPHISKNSNEGANISIITRFSASRKGV